MAILMLVCHQAKLLLVPMITSHFLFYFFYVLWLSTWAQPIFTIPSTVSGPFRVKVGCFVGSGVFF